MTAWPSTSEGSAAAKLFQRSILAHGGLSGGPDQRANRAGVKTGPGLAGNGPAVPPARRRPASASCPPCWPALARRRGQGDGPRVPAGPGAGREWPTGVGRHCPPGGDRQRRCGYGRDCCVAASIGCSSFPGGFLFQNHYPRFRGAPSGFLKGCPQGRPSVDSG